VTRTLILPRAIMTMDHQDTVIRGGAIAVEDRIIARILMPEDLRGMPREGWDVVDAPDLIALPGFVQTHIHLCQTLFRGLAEDVELLDWLQGRIFPFEAAHSPASMYASAQIGLAELLRSGTTTIMDMGSVHHEEEVVRAVSESGIRAFLGKALMDVNEMYPPLKEDIREAIGSAQRQAEQWHGSAGGRIRYAVAPRFILSCSDPLLKEAHALTRDFPGMLFHTHASENRNEMEAVRKRCGMDNVEYFHALGILNHVTCLAHCVWLNDHEVDLMAQTRAKVLHCPSSNLKLGSGIAAIPRFIDRGITVSLGADGAPCNNTLDMFQEMRLAALIQKPVHGPRAMRALHVLRLATMGGASALGIADEVGSIERGKKADIVLLDLARYWNAPGTLDADGIAGNIVHTGNPENVAAVMIDGGWVYRDGVHRTLDLPHTVEAARTELASLLTRIRIS
jgi:5-methylthioadenosine/S-adenosylhomocysteine deaminase